MKRKTLDQLANECANRLGGATWWYKPDLVQAFKDGWRAAKKVARETKHPNGRGDGNG